MPLEISDGTAQRKIGDYTRHGTCRFCRGSNLAKVLDFGHVPLAGAFLPQEKFSDERVYPLELHFCRDCSLVQVSTAVSGDVLFRQYYYYSSAIQTLVTHFKELAQEVADLLIRPKEAFVVEIGCNDGVFLKPLLERGIRCAGVDPATNVVESSGLSGEVIVNDFFTEAVARRLSRDRGQADAIVSSFSFAHIDNMSDVMNGVQALLKDDGAFIFEVYYLGIILDELQYDMIYHEHMSYYSLTALIKFFESFGMEIYDLKRIPLRTGTIRFYARKTGEKRRPPSQAVAELLESELRRKFDSPQTYLDFAGRVRQTRDDLMSLLDKLKREGKRIVGYGASGRAATIMNFCGIDTRYLEYVADDAPAKQGLFMPGVHVPIRKWDEGSAPPEYVLVFAWSFLDEVRRRRAAYLQQGGQFIIPLPHVHVVGL